MNHQPFRDWLLSDDELPSAQAQLLQEHLSSCKACQGIQDAWAQAESVIKNTPSIEPAPGFTNRWLVKLASYEKRKTSVQGWIPIGLTVPVVIFLASVLAYQVWALANSPGPYIAAWFSRLFDLLSMYYSVQHFVNPFGWEISIYSFIAIFFLTGIISFMSVLWLAAYRRLNTVRRFA